MDKTFSPKLVDLYCDLAAHLLTLEFVQSMPVWQEWLAERVLTGLPRREDYNRILHERVRLTEAPPYTALGSASYADTYSQCPMDFVVAMRVVSSVLRQCGLPPFPREHELDSEVEHKLL